LFLQRRFFCPSLKTEKCVEEKTKFLLLVGGSDLQFQWLESPIIWGNVCLLRNISSRVLIGSACRISVALIKMITSSILLSILLTQIFSRHNREHGIMNSFQEKMINNGGNFNYTVGEKDHKTLYNGTLNTTFDNSNIWMYKKYMSEKAYKASILNFGHQKPFETIFQNNKPVLMMAFGGSITCSMRPDNLHPDIPDGSDKDGWPIQLVRMLQLKYNSSQITMRNHCRGGVGTSNTRR
jgi:hypothetical protein